MQAKACPALPDVTLAIEGFCDMILDDGFQTTCVQVIQRWWLYADGSYAVAMHRADDPLAGASRSDDDSGVVAYLHGGAAALRRLAAS